MGPLSHEVMPNFNIDLVDLDRASCDQGEEAQLVGGHDGLFRNSM